MNFRLFSRLLYRLFLQWFLLAGLAGAPALHAQTPSQDDQARFLAGMAVRSPALEPLTRSPAYREHVAAFDKAWMTKEQRALEPIRQWARAYGSAFSTSQGPVYYLFSGPDFLYANTLFPNASTYILCGTEPVGAVPDLSHMPPQAVDGSLAGLRRSMKTMLSFNYFITKEMRTDLQGAQLGGTLPILYVFIARLGGTIREVSLLNSPAKGVRIVFQNRGGARQSLYYFKTDLSNSSANSFLKWCAAQGQGMSLLKAGSYLLHNENFSQARRFLLDHSRVIVQDDSGIPLRAFDPRWSVRLFGNYNGPIELFSQHTQPDLITSYQRSAAMPLNFAFGYHWQPSLSVLMVASRNR